MNKKYELGIAFGGGGTRGYYHAGVLKRLLELGYKPQIVAGTSVGAIVAPCMHRDFPPGVCWMPLMC